MSEAVPLDPTFIISRIIKYFQLNCEHRQASSVISMWCYNVAIFMQLTQIPHAKLTGDLMIPCVSVQRRSARNSVGRQLCVGRTFL
jgi:hypothetical protein